MVTEEKCYIVVGSKPWNRRIFTNLICKYPGKWSYFDTLDNLSAESLKKINPRYIFFLHWSLLVPDYLTNNFECVCFHMTDVPYGRGGSPLQNLILNGHKNTKMTALRMVHDFDAGPVYLKRDLSLYGNAEEIYIRATYLSAVMIEEIIRTEPSPVPQSGTVVNFKRRTPAESRIPEIHDIESLYDFIRMLDAEGYPKAFFEINGYRFSFQQASLYNNRIVSNVIITKTGAPE